PGRRRPLWSRRGRPCPGRPVPRCWILRSSRPPRCPRRRGPCASTDRLTVRDWCHPERRSFRMTSVAAHPDDVVLVGGARTPYTRLAGALASLTAVQLGAHAIAAAVERAHIEP